MLGFSPMMCTTKNWNKVFFLNRIFVKHMEYSINRSYYGYINRVLHTLFNFSTIPQDREYETQSIGSLIGHNWDTFPHILRVIEQWFKLLTSHSVLSTTVSWSFPHSALFLIGRVSLISVGYCDLKGLGSQPWEFAEWTLKLAPVHGGQGVTEERTLPGRE